MSVSDEMVERVVSAMRSVTVCDDPITVYDRRLARAAIAALSTPEFVLPLAEEMLRGVRVKAAILDGPPNDTADYVELWREYPNDGCVGLVAMDDLPGLPLTLIDAYRAAKGE